MFQPNTYSRRTKQGMHIPKQDIAEASAQYLATELWGTSSASTQNIPTDPLPIPEQIYNTDLLTIGELSRAIAKLKRHKTPGPDNTPTEFFKEMHGDSKLSLLQLLNDWWEGQSFPEDLLPLP